MTFFTILIGLIILLFFLKSLRRKTENQVLEHQISHFSNIGFNSFYLDEQIVHYRNKIEKDGRQLSSFRVLQIHSGIELWGYENRKNDLDPFFRAEKHPVSVKETLSENDLSLVVFSLSDGKVLAGELIPYQETFNGDELFITLFAEKVEFYDTIEFYEKSEKTIFRPHLISIPDVRKNIETENALTPTVMVAGVISDYTKVTNPESGGIFYHVKIQFDGQLEMDAVWDPAISGRFPQTKNVVIGNFYLFVSPDIAALSTL